jgi:hypothetical protein
MKQLKSSLKDLRDIFDRSITVRDIAEPVVSFDDNDDSLAVKTFMQEKHYDYLAVRCNGHIAGYAVREELGAGTLQNWRKDFDSGRLVSDRTSLLEILFRLRILNPIFVSVHDKVWGIVTKGDLQKFPVRMWLFGVLSMVEMHMLRLIRQQFANDRWQECLSAPRIQKAECLFKDRSRRNQEIDLDDCLEWCDKAVVVSSTGNLRQALGFESKSQAKHRLGRMEELRNSLAHGQDLLTGNWPRLIEVIRDAERLLDAAEKI